MLSRYGSGSENSTRRLSVPVVYNFFDDGDYRAYLNWLKAVATRYELDS